MSKLVAVQILKLGHCIGMHHSRSSFVDPDSMAAGRKLLQSGAQAGAGAQAGSNGGYGGGSMSSAQANAQAQSGLDGGNANAAAQAIASSGVSHA